MALSVNFAALASVGLLLAPLGAQAAQVTNGDADQHVIEVYIGDSVEQITLAPGETKTGVCNSGCSLLMDDSAIDLQGDEKVVIKGNQLSLDQN